MTDDTTQAKEVIGEPVPGKQAMHLPVNELDPLESTCMDRYRWTGNIYREGRTFTALSLGYSMAFSVSDQVLCLAAATPSLNQRVAVLQPPALDASSQAPNLTSFNNLEPAAD